MALKFHTLASGSMRVVHHADRLLEIAFVIDTDFRDHQRGVVRTNATMSKLKFKAHVCLLCI